MLLVISFSKIINSSLFLSFTMLSLTIVEKVIMFDSIPCKNVNK